MRPIKYAHRLLLIASIFPTAIRLAVSSARIFVCAFLFIGQTVFSPSLVHAAADDDISSTATINYVIAGVPGSKDASVNFKEDRLINFTVSKVDDGNHDPVIENFSGAVMAFTLINNGNDVQDFLLASVNTTNNPFSSPADSFDTLTPLRVFAESGTTPGYQQAEDVAVYIDELASSAVATIYVIADMPADIKPDDVAAVALITQVAEGGTPGVEGLAITSDDNGHISPASPASGYSNGNTSVTAGVASSKQNTLGLETVFNDPAGVSGEDLASSLQQDISGNGQHADAGAFRVVPPVLIVNSMTVIDSEGNAEPRPGSTLRYQLDVSVAGNTSVENLVVKNPIPENTTYTGNSITLNGTPQTDSNDAPDDFSRVNKAEKTSVISLEIDLSQAGTVSVAPGENHVITFEVTID